MSAEYNHIVGIQGEPNTGKTTVARSWPNPLVLDFDKKLPTGIPCVEFWSDATIHAINGTKPPLLPDRRGAILKWLRTAGPKLPKTTTLIIDSYTMIDAAWAMYVKDNRPLFLNKEGEFNLRAAFSEKLTFNIELFALLKSLPCSVVITFHEQVERDEKGKLTGKYRTLVNGGSFKDQLEGNLGMLLRTANDKGKYVVQVRSNHLFDAMIGPDYKFPPEISYVDVTDKSAYEELQKYYKK